MVHIQPSDGPEPIYPYTDPSIFPAILNSSCYNCKPSYKNLFSPVPAQAALHTKIRVHCRALESLADLPHLPSPCPTCPGHNKHPAKEPKAPKKKGGTECSAHETSSIQAALHRPGLMLHKPVIPALRRRRPKYLEFKVTLNYLMSLRPWNP